MAKRESIKKNVRLRPVQNGSLVSLVVDRIKESLLRGELNAGDYLPPEDALAEQLGVGKSSVREAIKMLQALGVVEVRRGLGVRIREELGEDVLNPLVFKLILAESSLKNIIELRMVFEKGFTLLAMEQATEEDIANIKSKLDSFEQLIQSKSQKAEDDIAFHIAILEATHNPLIVKIGETILQLFTTSINRSMKDIPEVALNDHKRIYEAFAAKDRTALSVAIVASFEGWRTSLEKISAE